MSSSHSNTPQHAHFDRSAGCVSEPARHTPIAAEVDVLVAGGGPAGVGAALAAAREGASVLLIERFGMLGGMWCAGLLNPFFEFHRNGWIVAEIVDALQSASRWREWVCAPTFDTEQMKLLLEQMMCNAGASFWYHSLVTDVIRDGSDVCGVIVESKSGREAVIAKVVIDCTGDGDVAARAGAQYELGSLSHHYVQPMTLMFEMDGVGSFTQQSSPQLYDLMVGAISEHHLDISLPFKRVNNAPWIITLPDADRAAVQLTHVYRVNPLDTRSITQAIVQARQQAHDAVKVFRHIPELEHVRLTQTASTIGVRESRRIIGEYMLSLEDLQLGRSFDDAVASCGFGVDIHSLTKDNDLPSAHAAPINTYQIPYRCLLPKGIEGVLTAGRCISGTHEAHASYRVTGTCMALGQAAGLAATMSIQQGCPVSQLNGVELHQQLVKHGVTF